MSITDISLSDAAASLTASVGFAVAAASSVAFADAASCLSRERIPERRRVGARWKR